MNTTQAIVILKNGMKKYGSILDSEFNHTVLFIPGAETLFADKEAASRLIQYIPVEDIESIDTYLK
jgi:hypothetical protein